MKLACPACGAEVLFKNRASIFAVCSFCNSTLVRHDTNIESLGKMTEMPQDMSPLQIGSSGIYQKSKFEVVGRQRIGWEKGSWNEWYLYFDNGKDGWMTDAQGFYGVSFQLREDMQGKNKIPELASLKIEDNIIISGVEYSVDDIREVSCISSQGELPTKSLKGRSTTSVDLLGADQSFGNIEYSTEGHRIFLGKYVEFEDLKFMNLREIDGW